MNNTPSSHGARVQAARPALRLMLSKSENLNIACHPTKCCAEQRLRRRGMPPTDSASVARGTPPADADSSAHVTPTADADSSAAGSSAGDTVPVGADSSSAPRAKRARPDESGCAICLQPLTARLTLDGCAHDAFCRECVVQWGRHVSNTCPICRARFSVVTELREGAAAEAIPIPHREAPEPDYDVLELVDVDLDEERGRVIGRQLCKERRNPLARAAPRRGEVDDDELLAGLVMRGIPLLA